MKVIRSCNSLEVAQKVKRLCNKLNTDGRLCSRAYWYSFDNGREQGFVLRVLRIGTMFKYLHLAVAENRNSDDIVVYYYHDTTFPTNLPAHYAWKNNKYFLPGDYKGAAKYILTLASEYLD